MTKTDYFRKLKAILTRWAFATQDANASRLERGLKLDKATGKTRGKMAPLARFTQRLKAFRGQSQRPGLATGAMLRALRDRKNYVVRKDGSDMYTADILIDDSVKGRLEQFESAAEWHPTRKEAYWLTMRSLEMADPVIFGVSNTLRRPARPFFGRSKEVDDQARAEINELRVRFVDEKLKELSQKSKRRRKR